MTCHAVRLMEASSLIPRMLSHVLKLTAGQSQITPKVPIHDLAGCGIDDIDGTMPKSCFSRFNRNRTFPKSVLLDLIGTEHSKITCFYIL